MDSQQPRSRSVEDGQLKRLSVSQIESFEPTYSPWGCNRRWWYSKVAQIDGGTSPALDLGTLVHSEIERYLSTGADCLGAIARGALGHFPTPGADLLLEQEIKPGELMARGIPLVGRVDLINFRKDPPEIVDWKTTSRLAYAKTDEQLRGSVQLTGYALWAMQKWNLPRLSLSLVYMQTKGKAQSKRITCEVDRVTVSSNWQSVEKTVDKMIAVARETDPEKVSPHPDAPDACKRGFGCPYRDRCSAYKSNTENPFMGFLDKFTAAVPQQVLPPDAPKSDPVLAADPVEGFTTPIPPATAQDPSASKAAAVPIQSMATATGVGTLVAGTVSPPPEPPAKRGRKAAMKIDTIKIAHGIMINMGDYNSARVDVELSAQVGDDLNAAAETLSAAVQERLKIECAPYAAALAAKAKK